MLKAQEWSQIRSYAGVATHICRRNYPLALSEAGGRDKLYRLGLFLLIPLASKGGVFLPFPVLVTLHCAAPRAQEVTQGLRASFSSSVQQGTLIR